MASKLKTLPRVVMAATVFGGLVFGLKYGVDHGYIAPSFFKSEVPKQADLLQVTDTKAAAVSLVPLPSTSPASMSIPQMRMQVMAWNAQMGMMFANGGSLTTEGSLMQKHGANLAITREDDGNKMAASLTAFASSLKTNPQPSAGAHFVVLMGDGTPSFLSGINAELVKMGKEYQAEIVGSTGYSRGEDKFMGPADWKAHPKASVGGLIAGVIRDGDWNIAMKWAADNGIKNNPDETTYDPDALNWVNASDFIDAGQKYITGACEDRKVVHNGKRNGDTQNVCVNAVVTWTPGDVNVAENKGGLVSIVSTKEYRSQMPSAIVGIRKWDAANSDEIVGMLTAICEGGDQVKQYPAALTRAAAASADVYKEKDAAYWEKYYKGVTESDRTGQMISLGGSYASNYADLEELFGLSSGSSNIFAATYTIFGDIDVQQYPKLVPNYPKVDDVLNLSFVRAIKPNLSAAAAAATANIPQFTGTPVTSIVSKRNWSINFQTGLATFDPSATAQLRQLKNGLLVADELAVEVHGYTDNTGDPDNNVTLSKARAMAVKNWLENESATNFPESRFTVVAHGQDNPIATNTTETGRAQNRRVTIILGGQ
jgi:OmpA-OmpF porin, OOP family